jgi:hypothetical protein
MKLLGKRRGGQFDRTQGCATFAGQSTHAPIDRVETDADELRGFATRHQPLRLMRQLAPATS